MPRPFKGVIKLDIRDSKPDWPAYYAQKAPEGAPNVLVILFDDTGQAAWSSYGGRVRMPTMDRLAKNGLTYTQWHTTSVCSPTRSCFLTGRNHHQNGFGTISESAVGFPGYAGHIPPEHATMATVLRDAGWSTFWIGKNHNVPVDAFDMASSKKAWPLGLGYDRFYGFLGGEVIDYLEESGQLDNTLIFYCADNGASGEGSPNGSVNEIKFFNSYPDDIEENLAMLDKLGSPDTYNHYPTGWAVAFSTPYRMFKRYASYAGGTADPLVIHWPKGMKARGEIRHQYHHCTDIVPTILDCCGVRMPKVVAGAKQSPLPGVSMRYSFDKPRAPTTKKAQYYEMLGTRGIWQGGWKACTEHGPMPSDIGNFDKDRWQLFHTDKDRSEAVDLAARHPDRLKKLKALWLSEARKYDVLPLNDLAILKFLPLEYHPPVPASGRYVYYPDTTEVPEASSASTHGRSFKILAEVEFSAKAEGVVVAQGSRFGGYSLFVKDGALTFVYNFLGIPPEQKLSAPAPTQGKHIVGVEFTKKEQGKYGESVGTMTLYVDDKAAARGPFRTMTGRYSLCGEGLCVGRDSGDAVSREYKPQFPFTGGRIVKVVYDLADDQYVNVEKRFAERMARD